MKIIHEYLQYLNEVSGKTAIGIIGLTISLSSLIALLSTSKERKMNADKDFRLCKEKCLNRWPHKKHIIVKGKSPHKPWDLIDNDIERDDCIYKCEKNYHRKLVLIKKKQEEIKNKITKVKKEIKLKKKV